MRLERAMQPPGAFVEHFLHALGASESVPAVVAEVQRGQGVSVRSALEFAVASTAPDLGSPLLRAVMVRLMGPAGQPVLAEKTLS
jgi:hypothetical protein